MLAALVSVLALAGAPSNTTVICNPDLPASVELGLTLRANIPGPLDHIELGTLSCGALLYTSASPSERKAIRKLNPSINFDQLVGVGLQVALHESNHVALQSTNECQVEKTARSEVNSLIAKLGDPGRISAEESAATASDAALPAEYHGC